MNECSGSKFVLNGEIQPVDLFDNALVYEGDSVYEVIRMLKGIPVFFSDHMERLSKSVKIRNKKSLADMLTLRKDIISLTRADRKKETNIKIVFNYNGDANNYLVYYVESVYPSEEQYSKGVKGILYTAERKDPVSKVINHKLRSSIYHRLILAGGYEALLVNHDQLITEGSRSNIFFVRGELLVTAPDNMILNGITRKHVLALCIDNNIEVEFKCVRTDEIAEYDGVFMTGTSPMVLPFYCINDTYFQTGIPVIEKLRKLYVKRAEESLNQFRLE
jgi:branched-chain amino acid aminotransferase